MQFYQTLPVSGEVPYVVARQTLDPFSGLFAGNAALSAGPVVLSSFSAGVVSSAVSETPVEGAGSYQVAAIAPNFNDGALGTKVSAPNPITATAVLFKLPALTAASGTTSTSVAVATAVAAPGKYNKGELILSQNGAISAVAPLDAVLDESAGSVTISGCAGRHGNADPELGFIRAVGVGVELRQSCRHFAARIERDQR